MELNDRIAMVTGAAHRVGRALALGLAREGAHVIVHFHSSAAAAETTVSEIRALGRDAFAVQADVSVAADRRRLIETARTTFGGLDVLVNSASRFERAPIADIGEADWDRVLGVNLKAPFFLSQAAVPLLAPRAGTIVNVADLSAFQAWPSYAHHAVSKAGLVHLTRVLALALGPLVRVNCIAPGNVLPPPDDDGRDPASGPDRRVVDRPGDARDVVDALLYLVRSGFVTGQVVVVDGGRMLL
jgi:pteridine reductase